MASSRYVDLHINSLWRLDDWPHGKSHTAKLPQQIYLPALWLRSTLRRHIYVRLPKANPIYTSKSRSRKRHLSIHHLHWPFKSTPNFCLFRLPHASMVSFDALGRVLIIFWPWEEKFCRDDSWLNSLSADAWKVHLIVSYNIYSISSLLWSTIPLSIW